MKPIATHIFVSLGVLFLILIMFGVYFFIADPYNLKPLIFGGGSYSPTQNINEPAPGTTDTTAAGGFQLSEGQKQALISFGIDPGSIPSSISTEQEACFTSALGGGRVAEIKAGAIPSAFEFYKAKSCI